MTNRAIAPRCDDDFGSEVIAGLSGQRKRLPAKYLYDAAGSRLFDRITELAEYYVTRTEVGILREYAAAMARRCGPRRLLIEPGAGSATKARPLLDQLEQPAGYVPVDVSEEHLRAAVASLAEDYPSLEIAPVVADFTTPFTVPELSAAGRVVFFPGSTLGNFDPPTAEVLLSRLARLAGTDGGLLLGVDLQKDPDVLERAYNDAAGVTAAFNRNLLARINRELEADFELTAFRHRAFYNHARSRIEMHLVSVRNQQVRIGTTIVNFRAGESIHTENSYKYNLSELSVRAARRGLRIEQTWTDPKHYFAVLYLRAAGR